MLYYTLGQWRVFLAMIPAGYAAGAWFGAAETLCALMKPGKALRCICDTVTAIGIWAFIVLGLLWSSWGEIRLYSLLGALAGFCLERATLGQAPKAARAAYKKICKIIRLRQEKREARRSIP